MDVGDALSALAIMIAIVLGFAGVVAFSAIVWFGLAEGFRRLRKPPWDFSDDAERLHKLMHPEDEDDEETRS